MKYLWIALLHVTLLFGADPIISSIPTTDVNQDTIYSYEPNATDADGDPLIWSIDAPLPSWLSAVSFVSTFAGTNNTSDLIDATGTAAAFRYPEGLVFDSAGNLFVADGFNNAIRRITPDGNVTTFVGDANTSSGFTDGNATQAEFYYVKAIAIDSTDTLYVSDYYNRAIRRITPDGNVTTLAIFGASASLQGIAVDASGHLFVSDGAAHKIYKITPEGNVTTFAGSGSSGNADGVGVSASFNNPYGLCIDTAGILYVADANNNRIRRITPDGTVSTIAGSSYGFSDGALTNARFAYPYGITVDTAGTLYIADYSNRRIRSISEGVVRTLAGDGQYGHDDGYGNEASFEYPDYIAVDEKGNVFVTENNLQVIKKIAPFIALQGTPGANDIGSFDINLSVSDGSVSVPHAYTITVNNINDAPTDITISSNSIDENAPSGTPVATLAALDPDALDTHIFSLTCSGADDAHFTIDGDTLKSASIFDYEVRNTYNICIQVTDANGSSFDKTFTITINNLNDHAPQITSTPPLSAGQNSLYSYTLVANDVDGNETTWSALSLPSWLSLIHTDASMQTLIDPLDQGANALAVDAQGNLFISDTNVDAGYSSIKKLPTSAALEILHEYGYAFSALAVDADGILYFCDDWDSMVYRFDPQDDNITRIDDGSLNTPRGMAIDTYGNLYIADTYNNEIKKIDTDGVTTTLLSMSAAPRQIAIDTAGNLYVTTDDDTVEKLDTNASHSVLVSSGLNSPRGIAVDEEGNLYVADTYNSRIVIINTAGQMSTLVDTGLAYPSTLAYADGALYIGDGSAVKKYTLERNRLVGTPSSGDIGVNDINLSASDGDFQTEQHFQINVTGATGPEGICGSDHTNIIETPHHLCALGAPSTPLDSNATHYLWECSGDDLNVSCFSTKAHYNVLYRDIDDTNLSTESVAYDAAPTAPTAPNRPGYTFTGWSESYDPQSAYTVYTATYNALPVLNLPDAPIQLSAGFGSYQLSFALHDAEGDPLTLTIDLNNTLLDLNRTYSDTNASPATLFAADYTDGNLTLTLLEGALAGSTELHFIAADALGQINQTLRIDIDTQGEPLFVNLPSSIELGKSFTPYDLEFEIDHTGGDDLNLSVALNYPSMLSHFANWSDAPLHVSTYRTAARILRLEPTEEFEGDLVLTFTLSDTQGHTISRNVAVYVTNPLQIHASPDHGAYPLHVSFELSYDTDFGTLNDALWSPTQTHGAIFSYTFERPGCYDVNVTAVNTQARSVEQTRTLCVSDSALDRTLQRGWNYLSLPAYATLDHEALKQLFADEAITQVYTHTHEGWRAWQRDRNYDAQEIMGRFHYLHSSQGLLLYTTAATTLHFPIDTQHNRPDDFIALPKAGWYLAGVNATKTPRQIRDLVAAQGRSLRFIQLYVGTQLHFYTPDPVLDAQTLSTLPRIRSIAPHQSFWIYVD